MPHLPATAIAIVHRQLGHITSSQLADCGVSRFQRAALVDLGVLQHTGRSVYAVPGIPTTLESRMIDVSLRHPRGYITGPALGSFFGLRSMPPTFAIDLCVPHGSKVDIPPFVRLRQSRLVLDEHIVAMPNGMRCATFERLAFDLAADLQAPALSSTVEQMLQRQLVTMDALFDIAALLSSPRRPGSTTFTRMLMRRHGGAAAESLPELKVLEGLLARNVPVKPQHHLHLPNGARIRIDMSVPDVQWAVEVDLHPSHLGVEGSSRDRQRDRQLHLLGWQVERVTAIDLLHERQTLDELAELYRERVRTFRPR